MNRILLAFAVIMIPNLAQATGGVHCMSQDKQIEISIGMGHVPIYTPLNAYAKYNDKEWSSAPQNNEMQLGDSQGLIEGEKLSVDFADEQIMEIIISLRVDASDKDDTDDGYESILTFEDNISHKVFCLFE